MKDRFAYDVFVSYAHPDKPTAVELSQRLRDNGLRVWLDDWVIKPGDSIPFAIQEGLQNSRVCILLMSAQSLNSDWVTVERQTVLFRDPINRKRRFVPVRLDDTEIPAQLCHFKYIDFRNERDVAYSELLEVCLSTPDPSPAAGNGRFRLRRRSAEETDARNRHLILHRVAEFWITTLLDSSYVIPRIVCGLRTRPDAAYQPWRAVLGDIRNDPEGVSSLTDCFAGRNSVLLLGDAGTGKTNELLEFARTRVVQALEDVTVAIPIVFHLATWTANKVCEEWIEDELYTKYYVPQPVARQWILQNEITYLLDGLDEVEPSLLPGCICMLNDFLRRRRNVDVVVCCRTANYFSVRERLLVTMAVEIPRLSTEELDRYLSEHEHLKTIRTLLAANPHFVQAGVTPLFLTIAAQAYPTESAHVSQSISLSDLFSLYISTMLGRHPSSKRYSDTHTIQSLIWLAKYLRSQSEPIFLPERLQPDCHEEIRGIIHLLTTFSAFALAAAPFVLGRLFACNFESINWAGYGILFLIVSFNVSRNRNRPIEVIDELSWSWIKGCHRTLLIILTILFFSWFDAFTAMYKPSSPPIPLFLGFIVGGLIGAILLFNGIWRKFRRIYEKRPQKAGGYVAVCVTAIILASYGAALLVLESFDGLPRQIPKTLLAVCLSFVFGGIHWNEDDVVETDTQGMTRTIQNCLIFSGCWAIAVLLAFPLMMGAEWHISGLAAYYISVAAGLHCGGFGIIRHYAIRVGLSLLGVLGFRCRRFLNYCCDRVLLRPVGGGFVFLHRELMDHFDRELSENSSRSSKN